MVSIMVTLDDDRIDTLRALYKTSEVAAKILDHFASRVRDRRVVKVDQIEKVLSDITRADIIDVFRKLEELGFGRFVVGRRGASSRFEREVSLPSLGKAAAGQGTIVAASNDSDDTDEEPATVRHQYRLRPTFAAQIELPADLTEKEAERLASFIRTLPFAS